jgi:hypothetical protein
MPTASPDHSEKTESRPSIRGNPQNNFARKRELPARKLANATTFADKLTHRSTTCGLFTDDLILFCNPASSRAEYREGTGSRAHFHDRNEFLFRDVSELVEGLFQTGYLSFCLIKGTFVEASHLSHLNNIAAIDCSTLSAFALTAAFLSETSGGVGWLTTTVDEVTPNKKDTD